MYPTELSLLLRGYVKLTTIQQKSMNASYTVSHQKRIVVMVMEYTNYIMMVNNIYLYIITFIYIYYYYY